MSVKRYKYNETKKITDHFKVSEFRCKCNGKHDILIDTDLCLFLEKVREKLKAKSCNIYSGHRCSYWNKKQGGTSSSTHTKGYACDCYFLDQNKKRIPSNIVCSVVEDLGHKKGIAIRCGGSSINSGNVHIDTYNRKWYGDEKISFNTQISSNKAISDGKKGHSNFVTYANTPKVYYTTAVHGLNVRDVNEKIVDCLKLGSKINVYYIYNGKAKIGFNRYVVTDYIK